MKKLINSALWKAPFLVENVYSPDTVDKGALVTPDFQLCVLKKQEGSVAVVSNCDMLFVTSLYSGELKVVKRADVETTFSMILSYILLFLFSALRRKYMFFLARPDMYHLSQQLYTATGTKVEVVKYCKSKVKVKTQSKTWYVSRKGRACIGKGGVDVFILLNNKEDGR